MQRQDLPEDSLAETSTDKLFRHYMDKSYRAMMTIASTPSAVMIGVQRLLNSSSTIGELYVRPDMAEGILKAYREYDLSPQSISDEEMVETLFRGFDEPERSRLLEQVGIEELKITRISMSLRGADQLLLSPQFFPKLKGHEKAFLAVLLKRYDDVEKLQIDNGDDVYGAAMSSMRPFCLRLAEALDRDLHGRLIAIQSKSPGKRGPFMEEIRRFLSQ